MADFGKQIRGCQMIHEVYAGTLTTRLAGVLNRLYGVDGQATLNRPLRSSISVGGILYNAHGVCRLFVGGIYGEEMAKAVAYGYSNPAQIRGAGGWHPLAWAEGQSTWENVIRHVVRPNDILELHGHSAGGMIAEVIAKLASIQYPDMRISIDTYGSPCPSHLGVWAPHSRVDRGRWMNTDDPVPMVPWSTLPDGDQIGLILFGSQILLPGGEGPSPHLFRQPAGGHKMRAGRIVDGIWPYTTRSPQNAMERWMRGREDAVEQHAIDTYQEEFRRCESGSPEGWEVVAAASGTVSSAPPPSNVVMPFPLPYPSVENSFVAMRVSPDGIASDPSGTVLGRFTITGGKMGFLKINPRHEFKQVKVGNQWQVRIGQRIVAECDSPHRPRTLVRRLNSALRGIGTYNSINIDELIGGLQDWLTEASQSEEYSRPPVRIIT